MKAAHKQLTQDNSEILFVYDSVDHFIPLIQRRGFYIYHNYKTAFAYKVLRKLLGLLRLRTFLCFDNWTRNLGQVRTVIIFATVHTEILKYINQKHPHIRVILWYWNPVFRCANPNLIPDSYCEKWSFDQRDCSAYGLKFNTTFYFKDLRLPEAQIMYDVVFLGADKGRKQDLYNIKMELESHGLTSLFYVVDDNANKFYYSGNRPAVKYSAYLKYVAESKAILDYVQAGQSGQTLRPLEALFFRKKLITNDLSVSNYDFYNKQNIFIIGVDSYDTIHQFLNTAFVPVDLDIVEQYDMDNWLTRFTDKQTCN